MDKNPAQEDLRRALDLLVEVVDASERTRKSIEESLGISSGYLTRILKSDDLRLSNLLRILRVLGVSPRAFFLLAYRAADGERDQEMLAKLGWNAAPSEDELDRRVREALRRILAGE